jgi:hypothetical protein
MKVQYKKENNGHLKSQIMSKVFYISIIKITVVQFYTVASSQRSFQRWNDRIKIYFDYRQHE